MKRLDALAVAEAAFAEAATRGVTNISVVITDPGGHVRVAMRADGQGIFGLETATAKAITALGFNRATLALTPLFSDQATAAISGATHGRFAPLGGGVVAIDEAGVIVITTSSSPPSRAAASRPSPSFEGDSDVPARPCRPAQGHAR
jgi:uncharacterized protein GlcG (DUF336 family)